ncbi:MAG: VOC family protein [Acidimicrobiales bacterium]|nr:VOC family protein [Acidimicrobiales bacterium]
MTAVGVPVLGVSDLQRSLAFYKSLGFLLIVEFDGYAILAFQGAEVHLAQIDTLPPPDKSVSGAYLRVDHADEVYEQWVAAGAPSLKPPTDEPYGIREFATEDTDGNLWRVGSLRDHAPPRPGGVDHTVRTVERPVDGSPGTTDEAWLSIVESATCAGCGLTPADGPTGTVGGRILDEAQRWASLLDADDTAVRTRPNPSTWSALEYAAHVRDALGIFDERVARMLVEFEPELGWWDHEAAIEEGNVNDLDAESVVADLVRNAMELRTTLQRVTGTAWYRQGMRRRREKFTIETMARFALHEVVHHRVDAQRSLSSV